MSAERLASLAIVGRGRVGTALHAALAQAGVAAELVDARALPAELGALVYLLAVRDPAIAEVAREVLSRHRGPAPALLHTAGGMPSSVLREAGARSAAVLHPLVAFAQDRTPLLRGALFAIEGDAPACELASEIAMRLGGRPQRLDAARLATYHAAAALASNHVLALVELGRELFAQIGIDPALGAAGLAGLFEAVAHNLSALGLPRALTGPIARGDATAVQRHLDALAGAPAARVAYLATARPLCRLAREHGVADLDGLASIEAMLSLYGTPDLD